jgi:hypothetical protein
MARPRLDVGRDFREVCADRNRGRGTLAKVFSAAREEFRIRILPLAGRQCGIFRKILR